MGGLPEVEEADGALLIRGYSCPIGAIVSRHPEGCQLAAKLLTQVVGTSTLEDCERGDPPRCAFRILCDDAR